MNTFSTRFAVALTVLSICGCQATPPSPDLATATPPSLNLETAPTPSFATESADIGADQEKREWQIWRKMMRQTLPPNTGCYEAPYPDAEWRERPCGSPVSSRHLRHPLGMPDNMFEQSGSGGWEFSAYVPTSLIGAEGSFPKVAGLATVNNGLGLGEVFSFQLNSNVFVNSTTVALCGGSCRGWQQFVFQCCDFTDSQGYLGETSIENVVGAVGGACPSGNWELYKGGCYLRTGETYPLYLGFGTTGYAEHIIATTSLAGWWRPGSGGAGQDVTILSYLLDGSKPFMSTTISQSVLGLGTFGQWTAADFNVLGYDLGAEVVFNAGTTINVLLDTYTGTFANPVTAQPICTPFNTPGIVMTAGPTAESNSLNIVGPCCQIAGGVLFAESDPAGTAAFCPPTFMSTIMNILR